MVKDGIMNPLNITWVETTKGDNNAKTLWNEKEK